MPFMHGVAGCWPQVTCGDRLIVPEGMHHLKDRLTAQVQIFDCGDWHARNVDNLPAPRIKLPEPPFQPEH